jgi:hypothetical protein
MPESKDFNLSDYITLSLPVVGDQLWALKRKLLGQNTYTTAIDAAIRGDSHGVSKISPLLVAGLIASQGHKLPGMLPGSEFRKFLHPMLGRTGTRVFGAKAKPILASILSIPATQGLVSGEYTRKALQDKYASFLGIETEEAKKKRLAEANLAAALTSAGIPAAAAQAHMKVLVPNLYKNVEDTLDPKQKAIFDRFIRRKGFQTGDFGEMVDEIKTKDFSRATAQAMNAAAQRAKFLGPDVDLDSLVRASRARANNKYNSFGALGDSLKNMLRSSGPFFAPKDKGIFGKLLTAIADKGSSKTKGVKGFINIPKEFFDNLGAAGNPLKPGVLAHEVGHGVGPSVYIKGLTRRFSQLAPALATGNILFTNDENTARNSALISPLLSAPLLASEFDASMRGSNILKKLTKGNLTRLQRLSPFVGLPTYAAFATSPILAYLTKKKMDGFDNKQT